MQNPNWSSPIQTYERKFTTFRSVSLSDDFLTPTDHRQRKAAWTSASVTFISQLLCAYTYRDGAVTACRQLLFFPLTAWPYEWVLSGLGEFCPMGYVIFLTKLSSSMKGTNYCATSTAWPYYLDPLGIIRSSIRLHYLHVRVVANRVFRSKPQEHFCYNPCTWNHLLYGLCPPSRVKNKMEMKTLHLGTE
jgi:hypothetical protein